MNDKMTPDNFNSNKVFGISVSACVLIIKLSDADITTNVCEVADFSEPSRIISNIKCENGVLSNDNENVMDFEGNSQFEWRQGVKHDCSSIMELEAVDEQTYINKKKQQIKIEKTLVYPLIKTTIKNYEILSSNSVILMQLFLCR